MPRHSAPRRPARRVLLVALLGVVLAAGWLTFRAVQVHGALQEARSGLTSAVASARSGDVEALVTAQADAASEVRTARTAVDDPLWRLVSAVPLAGRSFAVTRQATIVAGQVVDQVLPPLLEASRKLQTGDLLTKGQVDLRLLREVGQDVGKAATAAWKVQTAADEMPDHFLLPTVGQARGRLFDQVTQLAQGLETGQQALRLAPAMLGAERPRRYFLAVQNNAETRGTGGLVGAYAVLRADHGRLVLERAGTNLDFRAARAPVVDLGPEFSARYDRDFARSSWSSAVLTPDWPSAAHIMAELWRAQDGGTIDGVLGVDPRAMAKILAVTGPAQLSGRRIGAGNVVNFVMRDEYAEFAHDNDKRKDVLSELAQGLYQQVSAGGYRTASMLSAVAGAGGSGHLQLWSAHPAEQGLLGSHRISGALPTGRGGYLQVVSSNAAGNKADYYIRRRVSYARTSAGTATVTVQLRNTVDAKAVPPVVILRADRPLFRVEPGQTRQLLSIYVGVGQQVRRMFVDGIEVSADLGTERGHGVGTVLVEIRPSRPTVVTAEVSDPGGALTYRQQPLVRDDELDLPGAFVLDQ